jgi:hypothetical protein
VNHHATIHHPAVTDAEWAILRQGAADSPALAVALAILAEGIASADYDELLTAADSAAQAIYDVPGEVAVHGVPDQGWRNDRSLDQWHGEVK